MTSNRKSSIQRENDYNDILSMLDKVKDDNNISTEEVRQRVNNHSKEESQINDSLMNYTNTVVKPEVPESVLNLNSYSECVLAFIQEVNYGSNNSKEYVKGHKEALEKYYKEINNNKKDIYVIEGHVADELNQLNSKDSLFDKGYYDGLFYIHKSLKRAKNLISKHIYEILKETIK